MFEQPPQDDRPIVLFANLTQEATQGLSSGGRAAAYNVDSILPVERRSIALTRNDMLSRALDIITERDYVCVLEAT